MWKDEDLLYFEGSIWYNSLVKIIRIFVDRMKKNKELMDNITYKIRNRDEISEQLVYIKV